MIAFRVRELDETTSTNTEIKRAIEADEPEGLAVRALRQTGGYGRQGRTWSSPQGGLYLSLLLRPHTNTAALPTLSLVVSLAAHRAVLGLSGGNAASNIGIKWPNDLVVARNTHDAPPTFSKLCGISLEVYEQAVCIGIGMNVRSPQEGIEVDGNNQPAYVDQLLPELATLPLSTALERMVTALLNQISIYYDTWCHDGFAPFADEYNSHHVLTNQTVRVVDRDGALIASGVVVRVDERGCLVLRDAAGGEIPVASGEAHLA